MLERYGLTVLSGPATEPVTTAEAKAHLRVEHGSDDTLIGSMWRTLKASRIEAVVHFGEPQAANGRDRRAWAQDLRQDILALRDAP